MYEDEIEKRRYVGRIGEVCVEFVAWNYATGIKRGDKNAKIQPGAPDYNVWFKKGRIEHKYGLEVKTKATVDNCVIDDKVLYNLIRTQRYDNEEREDVILAFLFWDIQEIRYIMLSELIGEHEVDVKHDWPTEILATDGRVINPPLLAEINAQLLALCDGISDLTQRYASKQVNMVYEIDIGRLERYPAHFLSRYGLPSKPKLNVDIMPFVQYYLERRNLLSSHNITIIYENAHKIKHRIDDNFQQLKIKFWKEIR